MNCLCERSALVRCISPDIYIVLPTTRRRTDGMTRPQPPHPPYSAHVDAIMVYCLFSPIRTEYDRFYVVVWVAFFGGHFQREIYNSKKNVYF